MGDADLEGAWLEVVNASGQQGLVPTKTTAGTARLVAVQPVLPTDVALVSSDEEGDEEAERERMEAEDGQEEERQEESLRQAALAEESAPAIASAHPVHFGADDMAMGHYDHVRKVKLSELSEWKLHDSGHYYYFVSGSAEIIWWVNANNAQTQSGAKVELLA